MPIRKIRLILKHDPPNIAHPPPNTLHRPLQQLRPLRPPLQQRPFRIPVDSLQQPVDLHFLAFVVQVGHACEARLVGGYGGEDGGGCFWGSGVEEGEEVLFDEVEAGVGREGVVDL